VQGWNFNHPLFEELIGEVKPATIFEVGSWKGASAIRLGQLAPEAHILCIDTWLGGADHLLSNLPQDDLRPSDLGRPTIYEQFLFNIEKSGLSERIHPLVNTSTTAAIYLQAHQVHADLIYLDGSHEYEDVFRDLQSYYPLLSQKGILFGDDFPFPAVKLAVHRFCFERNLALARTSDQKFWIIRKQS
jgi:predicted O-methyltransferase YrrM